MDALDYSKEMLVEARRKKIYQQHMQTDLSHPLDIADNRYEAVVCTGTFTYGHVRAHAFDELIRITRPGGVICFTIRQGAYEVRLPPAHDCAGGSRWPGSSSACTIPTT